MSPRKDEAGLVARAQRGDSTALAEIYERHHGVIYRYVLYRVGDESTAEDLTASVFVRVVESIGGFVYRDRPLLTWLYTIARNAVIDYHRRAGAAGTFSLEESLLDGQQEVEQAVETALAVKQLAAVMRDLTEDQRQVIVLKFVEDMSNEEVAMILGKSVGAVKSLQHRALAALHRLLVLAESR